MRNRQVDVLVLFSLLVLSLGFGCSSFPQQGQCVYNGRGYTSDQVFTSVDGCNTCVCSGNGVSCTTRACSPDAGTIIDAGVDAPPPDAAAEDAAGPTDAEPSCALGEGGLYPVNESFPLLPCNDCWCTDRGVITCTTRGCFGPDDCFLPASYRFYDDGGLRAFADQSTLSAPHSPAGS